MTEQCVVFPRVCAAMLILALLSPVATAQDQADGPDQTQPTTPTDSQPNTQPATETDAPSSAEQTAEEPSWTDTIDAGFGAVNNFLIPILFFDVSLGLFEREVTVDGKPLVNDAGEPEAEPVGVPLIVAFLLFGALFFTLRFGFINLRLFAHAIAVIRGRYDNPKDHGEISHFQALTSALSATVGLGNIAGVAVAISAGGPGAVFWMWVVAFFGMSSKFSSCTLAQAYRKLSPEKGGGEHVLGGPMLYLEKGMQRVFGKGFGLPFGKLLAIAFAIFAIFGSLGGGNMFQSNQTYEIFSYVLLDGSGQYDWAAGMIMAVLVGLVIVGGIRRIGDVTSKLVPGMCVFYVLVCLVIILSNVSQVPGLIGAIFGDAFNLSAMGWGGLAFIMVQGIKRGAFSNEAGLGSAAIAHSAAKTNEPVREGVVAMTGPFIDTIVICTMTALTILITQANLMDPSEVANESLLGAAMTARAFESLAGWMPILLCFAVFIFAFSTMISWSYYGERATEYLFGSWGIWPFRAVFLLFVLMGPMLSLSNVITFTDLLILSMAYPNILGMVILAPQTARLTRDYIHRLKSGQMKRYDPTKYPPDPAAEI